MKLIWLCLISSIIFLQFNLYSQSIKGTVVDKDDKPVQGLLVYISNTSIGTYTNDSGEFEIKNAPYGNWQIATSHELYNPMSKLAKVISSEDIVLNFKLLDALPYPPIEELLAKHDADWKKQFELFKKHILGISPFSKETKIERDEFLVFDYTENNKDPNSKQPGSNYILLAYAHRPLIIRNYALGYNIMYTLLDFNAFSRKLRIFAFSKYEEMDTSNNVVKNKWKNNRQSIWKGSFRHFVTSVLAGTYQKEGFNIYKSVKNKNNEESLVPIIDKNTISAFFTPIEDSKLYSVNFPQKLIVKYKPDSSSSEKSSTIENREKSIPKVDYSGNLFDADLNLTFTYSWQFPRVGDMLPMDYKPEAR